MARRILIVSSQVRTVHSGVGTYAAMVLGGLAEGADAAAVTVATWDVEVDDQRYPGVAWIGLGERPRFDPTPGRFWTLGRRLVRAFDRREFDYDVVHFLDVREGHAFVASGLARDVTVIGTVHDDYAARVGCNPLHYVGQAADPLRRFLFHRWLRRLEARSYPRFDRLLVNAQVTGDTVRDAYGLCADRLVPTTLTIGGVEPAATVALDGHPSLVFVGGNFFRKGLDTCVEALADLVVDHPGCRLHVVGDCASSPRIETLARLLGVHHAVEFHGHLPPDQALARLAGADLLVMPSRTEALGLVYLEAFRAGVPVIAGNRGGVTEIVRHGESGLLITPGAAGQLVAAVQRLLADPELRAALVQGGRDVLASRTPARLIAETRAAYRGTAADRPPAVPVAAPLGAAT